MSRSFLPQKRHRSREMALQMLYSLDQRRDQTLEEALEFFAAEDDPEILNYARDLTKGAWEHRNDIDNIIREHVTGWRPERMVAVDRAALRMAIYEGVITSLTPVPVAISEAVELAKTFGTDESGKFVNGVLGKIVRALPPREEDETHRKEQGDEGTKPADPHR